MRKHTKILRSLVVSVGVLIAPQVVIRFPDLVYTYPLLGGMLVGLTVYLLLPSLAGQRVKQLSNKWLAFGPLVTLVILVGLSFALSFFKVTVKTETLIGYYVFTGLGVLVNLVLTFKDDVSLPFFGKKKRRKKTVAVSATPVASVAPATPATPATPAE